MHHNALLRGFGQEEIDRDELMQLLEELAHVCCLTPPRSGELDEARHGDKRILFEGAQGIMLDVDHGPIRL